ncbi:hypothetical protein JYT91_01005 [archaeon AH-315-M20]|nr:hypothetical protein [archaeon AH-315-M20]
MSNKKLIIGCMLFMLFASIFVSSDRHPNSLPVGTPGFTIIGGEESRDIAPPDVVALGDAMGHLANEATKLVQELGNPKTPEDRTAIVNELAKIRSQQDSVFDLALNQIQEAGIELHEAGGVDTLVGGAGADTISDLSEAERTGRKATRSALAAIRDAENLIKEMTAGTIKPEDARNGIDAITYGLELALEHSAELDSLVPEFTPEKTPTRKQLDAIELQNKVSLEITKAIASLSDVYAAYGETFSGNGVGDSNGKPSKEDLEAAEKALKSIEFTIDANTPIEKVKFITETDGTITTVITVEPEAGKKKGDKVTIPQQTELPEGVVPRDPVYYDADTDTEYIVDFLGNLVPVEKQLTGSGGDDHKEGGGGTDTLKKAPYESYFDIMAAELQKQYEQRLAEEEAAKKKKAAEVTAAGGGGDGDGNGGEDGVSVDYGYDRTEETKDVWT